MRTRCLLLYLPSTRTTASGSLSMTVSKTRAARSGTRRPCSQSCKARIETKTIRELLTTQPQAFAKREDPLGGRVVDEPARQINLAAHTGKNLAQCRLDLATDLSSFHIHLSVPLFLIAVTSRDSTFLSTEVRSSRSALA